MVTHSSILAQKIPQRSLVGYSPWGHEELDTTKQLSAPSENPDTYQRNTTAYNIQMTQLVTVRLRSNYSTQSGGREKWA